MELEPNHIDDIFRRRLHDAEMPPPAFVWTNVEQELQKRKRRRFFLWLFALGIAGAGLWAISGRPAAPAPAVAAYRPASPGNSHSENVATPGQPDPSEIRKPEPQKNIAVSIIPQTPGRNLSPKGVSQQRAADIEVLRARDPAVLSLPAVAPALAPTGLIAAAPLDRIEPKLLTFSRIPVLPKARPFIRKRKDPKYCYDFAQNPNVLMLDAYAGPSFNKRRLEPATPDFNAYADKRRSTQQNDWSYNAGLRASLLLGRHFLLRTGLHYEQMTEVFEYIDPNYVKYIVEITTTIIDNKPVTIVDTVGVEYGENYVKAYNRYGLLDVPLEIGGEMRRGRFGVSINAGVSFNVLFWKRGTALSFDGQPVPFTPGEKGAVDIFRKRTGCSVSGSAQMFFHLQPTVRLFAEPYYRRTLKPVTLDQQLVGQRNSNWGVKIGMTKILD